ncbi:MAG TPA: Zn-dependent hydrolase [Solirubrobacteraceae bacterium]|nr:Zn-dependent hydrolase [Solirubrobacteraceae bacterium]
MSLTPSTQPTIDDERFAADVRALNEIGWTAAGGMQRTSFSAAHTEARRWMFARARDAGLETRVDAAGNHSVLLPSPDADAPTVMMGSHLDSVPHGGRFDGALGVLSALEVVRTVKDAGLELPVTLEAVDLTDEEGTFVGTLGSWAIAGRLTAEMLQTPRSGREAMLDALRRQGLTEEGLLSGARRDPATIAAFLELHIEQGPVLERAGAQIGIVTGIRGNASFQVTFRGAARHAGTTPIEDRRDAGLGAAELILGVRELITRQFPGCVANVGDVRLHPGAFNVVPELARVKLEVRSLDDDELAALSAAARQLAASIAERWNLGLEIDAVGRWAPSPTYERARRAIAASAQRLGLHAIEMPSGAGHDAQVMAQITTAGMVFVPSRDGISHHPDEDTDLRDCINGANVLLGAALELASES